MGIGINVNQQRPELPAGQVPATSLRTVGGTAYERAPIFARLLERLEHHYGLWLEHGLDAIFDGLSSRDFLRGRRVFVDGAAGTALGISRSGGLEVDLGGERQSIQAGEVTYEP
jgi:biotin-(acetyl-CoA carboxylase) ligase